ncbi:hypothetical protein BDQ17DRAFT_1332729 [Cyathus striatus]|nr:hypothetical protein BDQ17DRAFT_1332729 [Cyathus striatus]
MPPQEHQLMVDPYCQYIAHHGHPSSSNPFIGIAINQVFQVCQHSRALGPTMREARVAFLREFALLLAQPHGYCEEVKAWNTTHPEAPFVPQWGPDFIARQFNCPAFSANNVGMTDVISTLIMNRVPIMWIDHVYPYRLNYLDTHFTNSPLRRDLFLDVDDCRLGHLQHYGEPQEISEFLHLSLPVGSPLFRIGSHAIYNCYGYLFGPLDLESNDSVMNQEEVPTTAPVVSLPPPGTVSGGGPSAPPPPCVTTSVGPTGPTPIKVTTAPEEGSNDPPPLKDRSSTNPLDMEVDDRGPIH